MLIDKRPWTIFQKGSPLPSGEFYNKIQTNPEELLRNHSNLSSPVMEQWCALQPDDTPESGGCKSLRQRGRGGLRWMSLLDIMFLKLIVIVIFFNIWANASLNFLIFLYVKRPYKVKKDIALKTSCVNHKSRYVQKGYLFELSAHLPICRRMNFTLSTPILKSLRSTGTL